MSTEQKAKELVEKYFKIILKNQTYLKNKAARLQAKQCALISNQIEIDQLNRTAEYSDLKNGEWYNEELAKLEAVKTFIQNL